MTKGNEKEVLIGFGILTLIAIVYWIALIIIQTARVFFWFSLMGIILGLISLIYFSIAYFRDEEDLFDLEDESGLIALFSIAIILILYFFASTCYNMGYSEEAIKTKIEARDYLNWYNEFINIPNQVIEETINNLCQDPNYPCEQAKRGYKVYNEILGWKNTADTISKILINTKKVSN